MKICKVNITEFRGLKDFSIDFLDSYDNPLSLVVVIGVNGTGKTSLLDFINSPVPNNSKIKAGSIEWMNQNKERINESFKPEHRSLINHIKEPPVEYYKSELSLEKTAECLEATVERFITTLIFEKEMAPAQAYDKVRSYIKDIFSDSKENINFLGLTANKNLRFSDGNGNEFRSSDLSSGERKILAKLLPIYFGETKGKVVLMDEPEDSLHPLWQRELVPALRRASLTNDCQIILATHSPYIIGGAHAEEIRILEREPNGKVIVKKASKGPFGWQAQSIMQSFQGLNSQRTPEVEAKIQKLVTDVENGEMVQNTPLFQELEYLLGASDPDLVSIRIEEYRQKKNNEKN